MLRANGIEWQAPDWLQTTNVREGQALIAGIRPQALHLGDQLPNRIALRSEVVEYLGTESQLAGPMLGQSDCRLSAMVAGDAKHSLGSDIALCFEPNALHVFDQASGLSLLPRS